MPRDIRIRFGRAIRHVRKEQGINQKEAAERCRLHRSYYSGVKRGLRNLSSGGLIRRPHSLARFLIQIGVPTKPKARRIWFSRKRS